ncbi:MAG: SRPBCC domain-containing protein [Candidatus Lindowbacteria bacterium]|nr:SRPBCC domain-containing protein [Candidatus Lindowbacteria bacterium]
MTKTNTNNKELIIIRTFYAPIEQVWKAWTDPETLKKWWGPKASLLKRSRPPLCLTTTLFNSHSTTDTLDS